MSSGYLEDNILETVEQGLIEAVSESDKVSVEEIHEYPVTRHKVLLSAVRGLGLEDLVTIQWYLDGDVAVFADQNSSNTITTGAGVEGGKIPSIEDVVEFYESGEGLTVEDIVEEDMFDFLRDYYTSRNDMPFKEIYLYNIEIGQHLQQCARAASQNDSELLPDSLIEPVVEASTNLRQEMLRYPLFRGAPQYITQYEQIAREVLSFAEDNKEKIGEEGSEFDYLFNHLNTFYYKAPWQAIADLISYHTVEGPRENQVKNRRKGELAVQNIQFRLKYDDLLGTLRDFDIEIDTEIEELPELEPYDMEEEEILDKKERKPEIKDDELFSALEQ